MDRLAILKTLAEELNSGELIFPTHLDATLKLKRALDDPDCHLDQATRMIMNDPLLAARTVALANSATYNRSGNSITNVKMAVSRLGFRSLRTLVAALIVRQLNQQVRDPGLQAKARQLWEHSAHVAALAQVIARHITKVDPDTAMFAGIIHEIGGFYLISRAEEFPGLLDGSPDIWLAYGERVIARGVIKLLAIPDPVVAAVESLWQGIAAIPPISLADTLILANDIAPVVSPLHQMESLQIKQETTLIDFEVEDSTLQEILNDSEEEINSLCTALLA
ncbi:MULTISPECIES: HDOD domain-containing protein [unclassified Undibacterium]|uniref:HDOD domain-containing protein n=1 Tax=unclassified Undibacterium TaxID=2630295 RepID=UPI002AC9EA40|nr:MULTISPECIES: HDOD domain-containing protein [unclassified Undibacterium]MEB0139775.1 HDOD domain-containing protein [Undibacterium sp. CCC2.1]MEB0170517.1 HDOD domain-containing protein [Undibacterium sp. CCC1.1]MEB0174458.1 HDOD domain-containing protein [Undibacterium sp. CCC3.4]MEB0213745.1 HDOD domain-containing protein [Undibacterium sp. 5I2]WPX43909.1 HDOD domain-containing protein [Undibacterium sp. CCC3.4]